MIPHEDTSSEQRLLIIGWDGADWAILDDLIQRGCLPNLTTLLEGGGRGDLLSTIPSHSWAAWSTFLTGLNPAGHGVFDFIERHPTQPRRHIPVTSSSLKAPTFLEMLSEAGHEVRAANIPVTFPPIPVRGRMIGGVAIPPGSDPFYPPEFGRDLSSRAPFPINGMEWADHEGSPSALVTEALQLVEARTESFLQMLEGQWRVAVCVYLAPDRLQHPFGKQLDPRHPDFAEASATELAGEIRNVYVALDRALDRLRKASGPETKTVLMSDHGFRPITRASNLSKVLEELGLLTPSRKSGVLGKLKRTPAFRRAIGSGVGQRVRQSVKAPSSINWKETSAYRSAAGGGISINLKSREPEGTILVKDYDRKRDEVRDALISFVDPLTGERPVAAVRFKEELYSGPYLDLAPDMVVTARDMWTFSHVNSVSESTDWPSGMHRRSGVLAVNGVSQSDLGQRHIADLAASALAFCGVDPRGLDGRVIEAIATLPEANAVEDRSSGGSFTRQGEGLSEGELDQVAEHLRSLGYIE